MTDFYVKVKPDSKEFSLERGHITKVYLEKSAEKGRANAELIKRFSDILDAEVGLISGHKSRRKKLRADVSEEELDENLRSYLANE